MTQRERQPSAGAAGPGPRAAADPPVPLSASWEELFPNASPAQQSELLALAARQGILYAHQLPPPNNGLPRDARRPLLAHLLAGKTDDLEPFRAEPVEVEDAALDPIQREAVAKALGT